MTSRRLELNAFDEGGDYRAECLALSRRHENTDDKARLIRMAEMWLRLAEVAEKNQGTGDSSPNDVVS
jgi:hypothetical protein